MIQVRSKVDVADNSGAKRVGFIGVIGKKNCDHAIIGEVITGSVKEAIPTGQVKKGEVIRAVLVRTHFPIRRKDGLVVKFDTNAVVIIDKTGNPRATRVFGPVARELRNRYSKIMSLAPEVI